MICHLTDFAKGKGYPTAAPKKGRTKPASFELSPFVAFIRELQNSFPEGVEASQATATMPLRKRFPSRDRTGISQRTARVNPAKSYANGLALPPEAAICGEWRLYWRTLLPITLDALLLRATFARHGAFHARPLGWLNFG